ncbi:hypothetical protein LX36DRAFT_78935 [Colletotrichum falcatum]|nr:hypothetical protein LX36DRAFT_78935 [Colletotrichum falcatum]
MMSTTLQRDQKSRQPSLFIPNAPGRGFAQDERIYDPPEVPDSLQRETRACLSARQRPISGRSHVHVPNNTCATTARQPDRDRRRQRRPRRENGAMSKSTPRSGPRASLAGFAPGMCTVRDEAAFIVRPRGDGRLYSFYVPSPVTPSPSS